MKSVVTIFSILFFFSCRQEQTEIGNNQVKNPSDSITVDTSLISEGIKINAKFPFGIKMDSIKHYDKQRNTQFLLYFPVSNIITLDTGIKNELIRQKDGFIKNVDEVRKEYGDEFISSLTNEFTAIPISVFKNQKLISYLFGISFYHSGAPHPVSFYYSYNFDNEKHKKIIFSDYFKISSKADTTYYCNLITKAINRDGICVGEIKNIDFNVEQDTISFNFDDYEIGSYGDGTMQGRLVKKKLLNRIKTKYH